MNALEVREHGLQLHSLKSESDIKTQLPSDTWVFSAFKFRELDMFLHHSASFSIDTVGKLQKNVSISSVKTKLFQYQSNLIAFVLGYANC